jgi:glucose-6-phosphate isomerase
MGNAMAQIRVEVQNPRKTTLCMPKGYDFSLRNPEEGKKILDDVHSVRDKIEAFTRRIRSGEHKGVTGKELKNIIAIGIGGSQLGPEPRSCGSCRFHRIHGISDTNRVGK